MLKNPVKRVNAPRPSKAEEQGRLFWVWLLTLPIVLMLAASRAFGAPWPSPSMQRLAMVALAFPVLFVVGEPILRAARDTRRRGGWDADVMVAGIAVLGYVSGLLAIVAPTPPLAGPAAILVAAFLSVRYLRSRKP